MNLALNRPAYQISDYKDISSIQQPDRYFALRSVDGNKNTSIFDGCCSCTDGNFTNPWWAADLGRKFSIIGVNLTSRGDWRKYTYELYALYIRLIIRYIFCHKTSAIQGVRSINVDLVRCQCTKTVRQQTVFHSIILIKILPVLMLLEMVQYFRLMVNERRNLYTYYYWLQYFAYLTSLMIHSRVKANCHLLSFEFLILMVRSTFLSTF